MEFTGPDRNQLRPKAEPEPHAARGEALPTSLPEVEVTTSPAVIPPPPADGIEGRAELPDLGSVCAVDSLVTPGKLVAVIGTTDQEFCVFDPFSSVCGRFVEDPERAYGVTREQIGDWWRCVQTLRADGVYEEGAHNPTDAQIVAYLAGGPMPGDALISAGSAIAANGTTRAFSAEELAPIIGCDSSAHSYRINEGNLEYLGEDNEWGGVDQYSDPEDIERETWFGDVHALMEAITTYIYVKVALEAKEPQGAAGNDAKAPDRHSLASLRRFSEGLPRFETGHFEVMQDLAFKWMAANMGTLLDPDNQWEVAFSFFLGADGGICCTPLTRGDEAEVDLPEPPEGSKLLGSLHTHVGSEGELSAWDEEMGRAMAGALGDSYAMFVVGPSDDGGFELSVEVFEPEDEQDR